MKYFKSASILSIFLLAFGGGIIIAQAQSYTPLAPLPGTFTTNSLNEKTTNLSLYISGVIKLLIALGAALAVLFAVIGGTQYVAASINPSAKSAALEKVQNALIGLTIILTSYLLLNSINPSLVNVNFKLPAVSLTATELQNLAVSAGPSGVPGVTGAPWPSDASERSQLAGIAINRSNCTVVGERPCTTVAGLSSRAINGLASLSTGCKTFNSSCSITVTGGTEYWMHGDRTVNITPPNNSNPTAHKPGGNVVDLSKNNGALNTYIQTKGTPGTGCASGIRFSLGGATYVDEQIPGNDPHWHVCY